jgi:hypothetical protein
VLPRNKAPTVMSKKGTISLGAAALSSTVRELRGAARLDECSD